MTDISKCSGKGCPIAEDCYRFKAKASEYQSYFTTPPYKNGKCSHYWPVRGSMMR